MNYAESVSKLEPGKHVIKILVKCNYNEVVSGIFTILGSDFTIYKKRSEELNALALNIITQNALMPGAEINDAALEARMLTSIRNSNAWKNGRFDATEILRLVIIDPDWTIRRNEFTGAILHRYIRAAIAVKTKDGNCAYYNLVTFQEDYVGGKFQPLKYDGAGDKTMMDCANIRK